MAARKAKVRIVVDGVDYEVEAGSTLLQSLDDLGVLMNGVDIPHYCWHPKLSIDGSCRLCQVVIREGGDDAPPAKLEIACNTPVSDGMQVDTRSEAVRAAREGVMELLLVNHPLDCPICDQAGECKLQDYAYDYGVTQSRTREPRRVAKKRVDLGPTIVFDQERCILCRRCVRFCREVTGTGELGVFDRGDRSLLETFPGTPLTNDYSMNVADICPVGALATRDFRFKVRVWFLEDVDTICTGCSRGCNVHAGVYKNEIHRYVPRRNDEVNGTWMCDAGRLSYKEVAREDRLSHCLARAPDGELIETSFEDAVWVAGARLRALVDAKGAGVVAGVASAHASNEDLAAFRSFLEVLETEVTGLAVVRGDADELLVEEEKGANGAGARAAGFGDVSPMLERIRGGGIDGLILFGHDLVDETLLGSTDALEAIDTVIVLDTHHSPLDRVAHVVFPVRLAAEKDASYTNSAGLVQQTRRAVAPGANVLDEADVLARVGAALGLAGYGEL
jgi:NADH-quinone oxidoreductase subunit G